MCPTADPVRTGLVFVVYLSVCTVLCMSFWHSGSLSPWLCLSLSLCLNLCVSISLCLCPSPPPPPLFLSLNLSSSLSFSASLSLSDVTALLRLSAHTHCSEVRKAEAEASSWAVARLAEWRVVQSKLLPMVLQHSDDRSVVTHNRCRAVAFV